ncbi:ATP-binding protein [Sphingomonas sp. BK235]|uniref:PAS domain-containing sensor histidine kinase n=1 Tax=Sphingomonas sp. BK235 TaxID=2512131 RepID=UPI00104ECE99|nr:ATP-binding protein [Sphingomonas sp. BK235]TCP36069.1 PAS domain-containing protein [Sphingomonas sp. BK235]
MSERHAASGPQLRLAEIASEGGPPSVDLIEHIRLIEALTPSIVVSQASLPSTAGWEPLRGWHVESISPRASQMLEAPFDEQLLGLPLDQLVPEGDQAHVAALLAASLAGASLSHVSLVLRTCAGAEIRVMVGAIAAGGLSVRLVFAPAEMPADTSAQLRASEQRYRQLFHDMPIALLRIDARGSLEVFEAPRRAGVTDLGEYMDAHPEVLERALDLVSIAEANDHAEGLFGTGEPGSMLRSVRPFWKARPDTFRRMLMARYRGARSFIEETVVCSLDGTRVPVLLSQAFSPGSMPRANSLIGMIDISGQVRAEAELQRTQARYAAAARVSLTSELAASIAHEVNQPLSSITTNGDTALRWLAKNPPDVQRAENRLRRIVEDAERASGVVRRLRDMSVGVRTRQGRISLNEVAQEALLIVGEEAASRAIELRTRLLDDLPSIMGDHVQLTQVVVNLLTNAIQAIDACSATRREIHLRTASCTPGWIRLTVSDTGPGVEDENIDRVFESFFSTKPAGIGMGLAICRSITAAHGGSLAVERAATGGAMFTMRLPVETRQATGIG